MVFLKKNNLEAPLTFALHNNNFGAALDTMASLRKPLQAILGYMPVRFSLGWLLGKFPNL